MLTLDHLFLILQKQPDKINFSDVIALIDALYNFTSTAFNNGEIHNQAGENNGSCKLFFFAKEQRLTEINTLHCFGEHYQKVLNYPNGTDHANIRQFMKTGWSGISYESNSVLIKKPG